MASGRAVVEILGDGVVKTVSAYAALGEPARSSRPERRLGLFKPAA